MKSSITTNLMLSILFLASLVSVRGAVPPGTAPVGGARPVTAFTGGGASRTPVYVNPYYQGQRAYVAANMRYGRQRVVILPGRDLRGARINLRGVQNSRLPNSSIFSYRGPGVGVNRPPLW